MKSNQRLDSFKEFEIWVGSMKSLMTLVRTDSVSVYVHGGATAATAGSRFPRKPRACKA